MNLLCKWFGHKPSGFERLTPYEDSWRTYVSVFALCRRCDCVWHVGNRVTGVKETPTPMEVSRGAPGVGGPGGTIYYGGTGGSSDLR